jgi:cytoskeletal protein CcmA (bactofilin family)
MKNNKRLNSFLGEGTQVEGKLKFEGALRIDGRFKGEISSTGSLSVGEKAVIEADIHAASVLSSGEIKGSVYADEVIEIVGPGKMHGNIEAPNIVTHPGVFFKGNCDTRMPNNKVDGIPVCPAPKFTDKRG